MWGGLGERYLPLSKGFYWSYDLYHNVKLIVHNVFLRFVSKQGEHEYSRMLSVHLAPSSGRVFSNTNHILYALLKAELVSRI